MENTPINIEQDGKFGATNIGIQNIHNGMSPEAAAQITIKLFMDNFPKLEEIARQTAQKRAEELCGEIMSRLARSEKPDFAAFADPDVQYVLYEAQKEYARMGTRGMLDILASVVTERINHNDESDGVKAIFDEAVRAIKFLKKDHLNYLSLTFICKSITFEEIKTLDDLQKHCNKLAELYPVPSNIAQTIPVLLMCNLLKIGIGDAADIYAKKYDLAENDIKAVLPASLKNIPGDYSVNPVGGVLAIINTHLCNHDIDFSLTKWLNHFMCG